MTDQRWSQLEELREQMAEASRGLSPADSLLAFASRLGSILAEGPGSDLHPVQRDVADFFKVFNLPIGETPAIRNPQVNADLILKEARETAEAITGRRIYINFAPDDAPPEREQSLAEAIDGLCDLLATIYGAAVTFGVDLAPFWDEIHRTNMAKAGGPKRADGKQLKPEGWIPPNIVGLLSVLHPFVCRVCGCTYDRACWHEDLGGCSWAEPGLCTACAPDAGGGWEHPGEVAA